ncbi:hypothetical protein ACOME3_004571 [Neoechinorhynchus agilis]
MCDPTIKSQHFDKIDQAIGEHPSSKRQTYEHVIKDYDELKELTESGNLIGQSEQYFTRLVSILSTKSEKFDDDVSVVGPQLIDESPKTECETEEKPDSKTNEQNYLSELLEELEQFRKKEKNWQNKKLQVKLKLFEFREQMEKRISSDKNDFFGVAQEAKSMFTRVVSGMEMKLDNLRDSNEKLKNALKATEHHSEDLQMVVQCLNEHADNLDLMLSDKDFEIDILQRQRKELLNKLKGLETDYQHIVTENTRLLGAMGWKLVEMEYDINGENSKCTANLSSYFENIWPFAALNGYSHEKRSGISELVKTRVRQNIFRPVCSVLNWIANIFKRKKTD